VKNGFLVKIIPPAGYSVYRFEFAWKHIAATSAALVLVLGGAAAFYVGGLLHAQARVGELRTIASDQQERLTRIDRQASALDGELRSLEMQNRELRRLVGATDGAQNAAPKLTDLRANMSRERAAVDDSFGGVAEHIARLRSDSQRLRLEGEDLRKTALHVLNMQHLEELSRAQLLAAIPSINPAEGTQIASGYGWRVSPWPEFHKGVDLDADYGTTVRATAAGTVVAAGWDGGFGIKIEIDHGNGYQTWYCHLSSVSVHPGERVTKASPIGRVGSTGESTGPHLHYQVMHAGNPIDPTPFLTGVPPAVLASLK
jgi:murein DD-endopeptidase MepM/ murein hydrolase activator NlpD